MAITRATNLAGLGTVFDALTDGGGLEITSGVSTISDVRATDLLFVGSGSTTGLKNQPLQVIGDTYISGSIGVGTTGSFGSTGNPTNKIRIVSDSINNATSASPLFIQHPKNTIGLFIGDSPSNGSTNGYGVNDYSSTIRYNGSEVAWGDISYYPKAGVGLGQFRFSLSGSTVDTNGNASLRAGYLYAGYGAGIGTNVNLYYGVQIGYGVTITAQDPIASDEYHVRCALKLEQISGIGGTSNLLLFNGPGTAPNNFFNVATIRAHTNGYNSSNSYLSINPINSNGTGFAQNALVIARNGLIGIGITAPQAMNSVADDLVVSTSGNTGITILSGSTSIGSLLFANAVGTSNNNGMIQYDQNARAMNFYSYGASYAYYAFHAGGTEKIRFPYTGGITFNGDTATANALDDYEEGTFTGTLQYHTDPTNYTTTNSNANYTGYYRKIGTLVYIFISTTSASTANYVYKNIGGLPFTCSSSGARMSIRVRGGRFRYSTSTRTDCLFYSSVSGTNAGLNAEEIGNAYSGWIEVVAASQQIEVYGCYHTD